MGKPPWSKTTVIVRTVLGVGRRLGLYPHLSQSALLTHGSEPRVSRGKYAWMLRAACRARDRYLMYARAKRLAMFGGVVVSDRFPIADIELMDGPVIGRIIRRGDSGRVARFLMALENSFYERMTPPDVLIVLRVDPEVAVQRKTDEDSADVRVRSTEVWETDWEQTRAHVIDGHQSPGEVLAELKSLIWSEL